MAGGNTSRANRARKRSGMRMGWRLVVPADTGQSLVALWVAPLLLAPWRALRFRVAQGRRLRRRSRFALREPRFDLGPKGLWLRHLRLKIDYSIFLRFMLTHASILGTIFFCDHLLKEFPGDGSHRGPQKSLVKNIFWEPLQKHWENSGAREIL